MKERKKCRDWFSIVRIKQIAWLKDRQDLLHDRVDLLAFPLELEPGQVLRIPSVEWVEMEVVGLLGWHT